MKIALIIPANIYFCPYLAIYTNFLKTYEIEFDVIYWDKEQRDEGEIRYNFPVKPHDNALKKFIGYYLYSRFVIKKIKKNSYSKLIVFTPQAGLFLYPFLKKHYRKRFVFDYRDLSIEQNMKGFFCKLLDISGMICISSPGFKKCLPQGYDYILSHNINIDILRNALAIEKKTPLMTADKIVVSTIGGIRDYVANKEVIDSLKNNLAFLIQFIGKGPSAESLEAYTKEQKVENVLFKGFYTKTEEPVFVEQSDFLNIYYPKVITHAMALSNRFYNALVYRRPMIVTRGGIQGDYVEKYNIGLAIDNCDNLADKLKHYSDAFNSDAFIDSCNELLQDFQSDYALFEKKLLSFLYN